MRKNVYLSLLVLLLSGCNFLDFDETSGRYDREDMYMYFNKASQMLVNIYSYMPQDFGDINQAMRDCGSDDAEFGDPNGSVQFFNNGNWSSMSTIDTKWNLFAGIRAANEFIESIESADFSRFKDDPNYKNWMKKLDLYPFEARVLRAHYFFELARRYGDIPMPLKMLNVEEANSITKTSFSDVIDFIVKECDVCADKLPLDYNQIPDNEFGRVTKGFAMAVKSKALLYAASKLHNSVMDKRKWLHSAKAAHDIIALNKYRLDNDGTDNDILSPEIILIRMNNFNNKFELNNFPFRFTEGKRTGLSGTYPTQNLVDAFQTIGGYDILLTDKGWETNDPHFDINKPYEGRDPRFKRTILANGMPFKGSFIEIFKGGRDYSELREKSTPTGYYLGKYIVESTSFVPEAEVKNKHHWIIYRYAETLLTYAESMIEAFNDPSYKDSEYTLSAMDALNQIRTNANMPELQIVDKIKFIEALRREWRVEFAFEDHRFWDVRRWMIGEQSKFIYGVSINRKGLQNSYSRFLCKKRHWSEKMNLYPIPKQELFNNPNLNPQNQGW